MHCERLPHLNKFRDFVQRAVETSEKTKWEYLNAVQLRAAMKRLALKCAELQTQVRKDLYSFCASFKSDLVILL